MYDESLKAGWLTFEDAGGARRRLAPIPSGWEDAPTDRLELMCRAAEVVQRKSAATRQLDDADVSEEAEGRQAP